MWTMVVLLFGLSFWLHLLSFWRLSRIFEFRYTWKFFLTCFLLFFLTTSNFIGVIILSWRSPWNRFLQVWYWLSMVYVGSVWVLCVFLLGYGIIQLLARYTSPIPPKISRRVLVVGATVLIVYSLFTGYHQKVTRVELTFDTLRKPLTVAQISDTHLGALHGKAFVSRVVAKVNALNPDLVVVTGDLLDGSGEVSEETLREFHKLQAPSFFVRGNHESYMGRKTANALIEYTPFRVLNDELVFFQNHVQIVGLDYFSRHSQANVTRVFESLPLQDDYFTLVLSHMPFDLRYSEGYANDLTLSGHTHSGQLFPFSLLVKQLYPYLRGLYASGGRYVYISSGTGTWGPPMRLGTNSEVTFFQLSPDIDEDKKFH